MLTNHPNPTFKLKKKSTEGKCRFASEPFCVTRAVSSVSTCLNALRKEVASF